MSRALVSRLCRASPRLFIKHGAWPSPAAGAPRAGASQVAKRGLANDESDRHGPGAREAGAEGTAKDDAARRRAELLKRYGDRNTSSGPIPVKKEDSSAEDPAAEDAEKSAADEADHNEIWGDYAANADARHTPILLIRDSCVLDVSYMEHQRKKGWKT